MGYEIESTKGLHSERVKVLTYGESSVGKSTQLGTLKGSILILSAEAGLLVLKDKEIDTITINSLDTLREVYADVREGKLKYDNVCIDSMTETGEMMVSMLEDDDYYGDPSNKFVLWGEYTRGMTKLIKAFRDLNSCNVIFTALSEPVDANGTVRYAPQVPAKKFQSKLLSLFDEVYYISVDKDGNRILHTQSTNTFVAKSRAGIFEPTIDITDGKNSLGSMIEQIKKGKK